MNTTGKHLHEAKHHPRLPKEEQDSTVPVGGRFPHGILHSLAWFWHTSRGIRMKSIVNIVLGLLVVGMDFAFIWATKMTIDTATGQSDRPLWLGCALLIGIGLTNIAISFARRWSSALLGVKSQNLMQLRAFARLMHSVWTGKEQFHSGDVMNRLIRDANEITSVITDTLPSALCVSVRLVFAFLYLFHFDSWLALIVLVLAPIFLLLSKVYIKKMRAMTREIRNTDSRIQSILQESIQHRMVLKTLEQTEGMVDRLSQTQSSLQGQIKHKTLFSSFSNLTVNTGFTAGYLLTFIWGVYRLDAGAITYGTMLAFIQLVGQIQGPFRDMTRFVPTIIGALTAAERMEQLEQTPMEGSTRPKLFPHGAGIRLSNVTYRYQDGHRNILDNFSFDFTPGSTTAILGETGAGKTTMIRLILALLTPTQGQVEFYDEASSAIASPDTRCNLVYVPQGNTLLSGTIRDNLLLGNPEATDDDMHQALRMACADFVLSLPDAMDTVCGEGGTGLSEGQAQRIAIARALLRQGNVLLLDEATSALDTETERQLIENIARQAREKHQTILFITHRPAVVEYCEKTLRLKRNV
ncbi:MAG: ABC transporter ATP-binding protein [Bacteroidaceae bacterium]|nr:ABC transporter ATP-binding protein [Bacteroidaceae bacterium]